MKSRIPGTITGSKPKELLVVHPSGCPGLGCKKSNVPANRRRDPDTLKGGQQTVAGHSLRGRNSSVVPVVRALAVLTVVLISFGGMSSLRAGTIAGTVRAEGKAEAEKDALCGKYDSRQFKFIERINYAELHDFLVFIEGPLGKVAPPEKPAQIKTERIVQKGATFVPHVLPIVVGSSVEWPNNDEILHNVFSYSETRQFDLGLYRGLGTPIKFDKPGRVDVFCSIHSRMSCVVMVLENPFFAMTNEKGRFVIENVPTGTYKLKAWHERLPTKSQEIVVPEKGEVKADFVLGITGLPAQ